FDYQNWLGFSIFADGFVGEIGRGGTYDVVRPDGTSEPAIGFSLYVDPLVAAGFAVPERKRCFLPVGHDLERAAELRAQGWITVAALDAADEAQTLGCNHVLGAESDPEQLG
ncbi:MAG TPA: ATP phosphoribosyltransferase regulatory subunit, partial [Croceibacterium sp.]|nr:ATP phosphoribosyltransferase regulatory subunit [Croceibacterium sp.]